LVPSSSPTVTRTATPSITPTRSPTPSATPDILKTSQAQVLTLQSVINAVRTEVR
jgi:hypothetical protein